MNLIERTLAHLQERRNKILNGGINCIPSPFTRFSEEFVGIEQGNYYCVTGSTKVVKLNSLHILFSITHYFMLTIILIKLE